MEKILIIDGKSVAFRCSGGFLIRYKELTGRDPIKDIYEMGEMLETNKGKNADFSAFDTRILYDLIWVLARTANPSVPDLLTWLDSFDSFPVFVVFADLQELIISAFKTAKEVKNPSKKKTTVEK